MKTLSEFPTGRMYLYLKDLKEVDLGLRVVAVEAFSAAEKIQYVPNLKMRASPIATSPNSRTFELRWKSYVAYSVINESYFQVEERTPPFTSMFAQLPVSAYLDFIQRTTICTNEYPGPLKHWQLLTLDHIVDVVSIDEPTIKQR